MDEPLIDPEILDALIMRHAENQYMISKWIDEGLLPESLRQVLDLGESSEDV